MPSASCPDCGHALAPGFVESLSMESASCPHCGALLGHTRFGSGDALAHARPGKPNPSEHTSARTPGRLERMAARGEKMQAQGQKMQAQGCNLWWVGCQLTILLPILFLVVLVIAFLLTGWD